MAYPPQQARFANANNYYDAPRSAPLESPREYRDNSFGGQNQRQHHPYDDGYGYNQGGREPPSRQQYNQGPPRRAQGNQPQSRSQQRGPGASAGRSQMRDPRGDGHQERGGYNQQYGRGGDYQQNNNGGGNGYSNDYHNQDHYQNQYDNGYGQEQYDDGYGKQPRNNYGPPQQPRQRRKSGGNRAHSGPQQGYAQGGYEQRAPGGQGRAHKASPNAPRQERERIMPQQPRSPDTTAWDNPFPTFPTGDRRRPEEQRPSTASGRYQEQTYSSRGHEQQEIHQGQNDYSEPTPAHGHQAGYHGDLGMLPPQPNYVQAPQRSNTMPTDLAQNMSNLNIQSQGDLNAPPRRSPPAQHLNFSQPRRPSAGTQGGNNSRRQSETRQPSTQAGGYDDLLDSYTKSPVPTPPTQSVPFASPGSGDALNYGVAPGHAPDRNLQKSPQPIPSYDEGRGRQQGQDFQSQEQRSRSQPVARNQSDRYHESDHGSVPVPATQSNYAQTEQNFPPRNVSNPQQYQNLSLQQQNNQDAWQQPQHAEFGPPARARTDAFGPGQVPTRNPSDPYQRAPSRGMGPTPVGQFNSSISSQMGGVEPRGTTPVNMRATSSESVNGSRPGMIPPDNTGDLNGNMGRVSQKDSLPGHPAPIRPGLLGQNQSPPINQSGQAARPPPVRNYGNPVPAPNQQQLPPSSQQYQSQQPRPQPQVQAQPQAQPQSQAQPLAPFSEGPVTYEELQRIRARLQQNPSDQALELHLAKRMLDAAATLADEGGRADSKTTSKNRDRYTMDANKIVKKLVGYNYTEAMFFMAECYGSGTLGLPKDPSQAFTLYQSAAKLNHAGAAYRVAVCCELGSDEGGGTRRDPLKAVQWYQRAATLGDVPAMYKIGVIKLKGLLGQPQNPQEAINWLRKAADLADAENPHALHELALLYMNAGPNTGVARDDAYAAQLLCQAADLGYKFSQFRLGAAYEFGQLGFPIDARQSITWYSKAATQEEHQSELALSGWYLTGAEGIMGQNDTEAYLWARKAANAGLAKAEYAMGYFTEVGIGCSAEVEGAKRWYWKAASQNFPKARERLEELRRGVPKMQKARVSRGAVHRAQGDCKVM